MDMSMTMRMSVATINLSLFSSTRVNVITSSHEEWTVNSGHCMDSILHEHNSGTGWGDLCTWDWVMSKHTHTHTHTHIHGHFCFFLLVIESPCPCYSVHDDGESLSKEFRHERCTSSDRHRAAVVWKIASSTIAMLLNSAKMKQVKETRKSVVAD